MASRTFDAIIIGAGAAGLAAARDLAAAGLELAVLEARGRVGGRVLTWRDADAPGPIELGAEFLHGAAEETQRIVKAARLEVVKLPDQHLLSREGKLYSRFDFWDLVERTGKDIARRMRRRNGGDFSFLEYLERARLSSDQRQMMSGFVEGYHAAHLDLISAGAVSEGDGEAGNSEDDAQHRVVGGYDGVIRWLRDGLDPDLVRLRLGAIVTAIRWKRGEVVVSCRAADGTALTPLRARAAVITVPHAVLKARQIAFEPAVPAIERALEKLEAGQVFKIVLRFREAFWDETEFVKQRLVKKAEEPGALNFVHANTLDVPTWWTARPLRLPLLTGWAGGPRAESLLAEPAPVQLERSLASLSRALAVPRRLIAESLEAWYMHDWRRDPFARAAYSYPRVGGLNAQRTLARPVSGTLFFAGEATSADETGTVAGALASGRRAARQIKEC